MPSKDQSDEEGAASANEEPQQRYAYFHIVFIILEENRLLIRLICRTNKHARSINFNKEVIVISSDSEDDQFLTPGSTARYKWHRS